MTALANRCYAPCISCSYEASTSTSVAQKCHTKLQGLRADSFFRTSILQKSAQFAESRSSHGSRVSQISSVSTEVAVNYEAMDKELQNASPFSIMDKALAAFGDHIAIAFSGAEDVALIEFARLTGRPFRVFSLDTGRLNPETYRFFDQVEKHYGIKIEYTFPEAQAVQDMVRSKGMFSFLEEGHQECCGVRKVKPLKKALSGLDAWITGQRKDQSPTRASVPTVQVDPAFPGRGGGGGSLVKFNPLANVSSLEVWDFLRSQQVPTNELHQRGFISIGWWWEDGTAKECGLHKAPSDPAANGSAAASGGGEYSSSTEGGEGGGVKDLFLHSAVTALSKEEVDKVALSGSPREEGWVVVLYAPWCPYCQAMEEAYGDVAGQLAGSGVRVGKFRADMEHKEWAKASLQLKSFPTVLFMPKGSTAVIKRLSERRDPFSLMTWVNALR